MRGILRFVVLAFAVIAVAHCYPGARRNAPGESDEFEKEGTIAILPLRNVAFGRSSFDIGDSSDYSDDSLEGGFYANPFGTINPFNSFLSKMQNVMNKLREQMAEVLTRVPEQGVVSSWGKIPEGANTTSTVKIIDGHVVTINETTYENNNDNQGTVFRVRIVDVKPQDETTEPVGTVDQRPEAVTTVEPIIVQYNATTPNVELSTTTIPSRSVETLEDFSDNEIPKAQVDTLIA